MTLWLTVNHLKQLYLKNACICDTEHYVVLKYAILNDQMLKIALRCPDDHQGS